jgi:hypothetical protein
MSLNIDPGFKLFLRNLVVCASLMAVPMLAAAQHKNSPAPASHASTPPHNSAPSHSAPPQHSNGTASHSNGGNMSHPGNGNTSNASHGNMSHGSTNIAGHGGNNSNTMHGVNNANSMHGGTNNSAHGGNGANTAHGGTNAAGHGGNNANNAHGGTGNAGHNAGNMGHNANGAMGHGPNAAHNGPNGGHLGNRTPPGHQVSLRGGGTAHIRPNGQIRTVNRNGMHIEHGMHGGRTVVSTHNGVRVVSVGHRGGYVQRAYVVRGGHSYYSRTYYYHGAYRTGVYRGYYYGGHPYYGYYPAYYYHPVYYGWAYNPWPAPVYYGWGWGSQPWYGYYGPYYAPYPVYPSAAYWITDFMIAATLQAAYEAQAADNWLTPYKLDGTLVASLNPIAPPDAKPAMSEAVKKELSEEVKATLAAEQAEAAKPSSNSSGGQPTESKEAPPALDPKFRTFIVSSDLSLVPESGDECALSQGDVITRTSETPDDDGNVTVKVVASTKSDCAIGSEGPVSTDDLQEMYNHFREQLKDGMSELAKKNGTGGLPKAPDTATVKGDVPAPEPDKSAEKSLKEQQEAADQTESEVKQEASSGGAQ